MDDPKLSPSSDLQRVPRWKLLSTEQKLAMCADLLAKCFSNTAIEMALSKDWECDERTVRRFIAKVRKGWESVGTEAPAAERAYSRARAKATLEQIISDRMSLAPSKRKSEDLLVVIQAVREINRMDGHHIKRVEHTGRNGAPIAHAHAVVAPQALAQLTDEQLDEAERALSRIIDMKALPAPAKEAGG